MKGSASADGRIEGFATGLRELVHMSKKAGRLGPTSARYKGLKEGIESLRAELLKEYVNAVRRED